MVVIADSSPVNYLVLIAAIDILPKLYGGVIIPQPVLEELRHPDALHPVAEWANDLPEWVEVVATVQLNIDAELAEWEYAARGGNPSARYGALDAVAWYFGNSGSQTHEVGQKQANDYGLHDMLGNVWEWVADWYGNYEAGSVSDPQGPSTGQYRTLRGGSWTPLPGTRARRAVAGATRGPVFSSPSASGAPGINSIHFPF